MLYKPSEIAELIGVTTETIYRSHLPAGAPFRKDGSGNIFIHGIEFATWAKNIYQNRKKGPMSENQAWCCKCNQASEIQNPAIV